VLSEFAMQLRCDVARRICVRTQTSDGRLHDVAQTTDNMDTFQLRCCG